MIKHIGLDIGTKTIVAAYENSSGEPVFINEINGYYIFERATPFIVNMLNDPNKVRSDGTKRPARWIQLPGDDRIIVLGRDAEEFAYAKNETLLRPMAEGGITADEDSMTVLASIIRGLLETASNDLGQVDECVKLVYCTTSNAINKEINVDYHKRVVDLILSGDDILGGSKLDVNSIKESHAIVINESEDGTGIGISWGAGTVTVSYVKYGIEVYSFCWVGSGDWIDEQVAMRHGYSPSHLKTMAKKSKETPTTICKRKHQLDLTLGKTPTDRIGVDLCLHYDILINQVIDGVVNGFYDHEVDAKIDEDIAVYIAGGTSSPVGFEERVAKAFEDKEVPFGIKSVSKAATPLYAVAEGLFKAARMF